MAMTTQTESAGYIDTLYSHHLKRNVRFRWMAPGGYRESESPLGLLLMNDGQDFEPLKLDKTLAMAFEDSQSKPFLYVGIETNVRRIQEYGIASSADFKGRGSRAADYTRFIILELLPFLEEAFNLSPLKEDRYFCGMSLGGLSAFDIVLNYPHLFGGAGVFSGSFWWRKTAYIPGDLPDRSRIILNVIQNSPFAPHLRFWLQCGSEDEKADRNKNGVIDSIDDTQDVILELQRKGYTGPEAITYREVTGGRHDLPTWGRVFPEFLRWAFGSNVRSVKP